jgi:hypothetical protein
LSHVAPNQARGACNHAEYAKQRRRLLQDRANRLDLPEQDRIEETNRHLIVHLENVSRPAMPSDAPRQFARTAWNRPFP